MRLRAIVIATALSGAVGSASTHATPATQSAQNSPTMAAAEPTGAISGVVLDAGSGKPVGGAIVMLVTGQSRGAGNKPSLQVADSTGRFVFTKLPRADFTLTASQLGYFDGGYDRASYRSPDRRITLADGQWLQNADIKVWRHGSMTGTVLDETGEPVVGVWVRALAQILIAGERRWVSGPLTKTDDRGLYRFAGLSPGQWTVMIPSVQSAVPVDTSIYALSGTTAEGAAWMETAGRPWQPRNDPALPLDANYRLILGGLVVPPPAASGRPQMYPITFYPSTRAMTDAAIVDLSFGEDRGSIDVALRPLPAFKISGVIQAPLDAVKDFVIRLMPSGCEGMGVGHEAATTRVAADGTFTFLSVPAGAYTIVAIRAIAGYTFNSNPLGMTGHVPSPPGQVGGGISASAVMSATPGTMFESRGQSGEATMSGWVHVDVTDRDLSGVSVPLSRGTTISGRIDFEPAPSQSSGSGAAIVSGLPIVSIAAEPANGDPSVGQPRATLERAGASFPFTLEGLQRGEYLLRVIGGTIKSIRANEKDYTYRPIDTTNGDDISGVVVTIAAQSAKLSGAVRDAQGRAITGGAAVICFPAEREQWSRYGLQPARLRSVTVSNAGVYQLPVLPAGDYLVIAVDDSLADGWKDPAFLEKVAGAADRVTLAWGDAKSQDLKLVHIR